MLGKGSYAEVFAVMSLRSPGRKETKYMCFKSFCTLQGKHFALERMSKGLIVCERDVSTGVIRIFAGFARRDRASAGNV